MPRSALGFANVPGPFQVGIMRRVARAVLPRIGGVGIQASSAEAAIEKVHALKMATG